MESLRYKIDFFSYWQIGSGKGGGAKNDSVVLKDENNFPFIPGRTLKGLIKDASKEAGFFDNIKHLFEEDNPISKLENVHFRNATLDDGIKLLINEQIKEGLYETKASTALDNDKQALHYSLRKNEVVIPLELFGKIENLNKIEMSYIEKSFKLLRRIGLKRHRGFGRCIVTKI
jgi:hypothetical protein